MNTATTTALPSDAAAITYAANQRAIARHLAFLQLRLAEHAAQAQGDPKNWGLVGDLAHVEAGLADLIGFLAV
jgi:hypothetical protein